MKKISFISAIFLLVASYIISFLVNAAEPRNLTIVNYIDKVITVQVLDGMFKGQCGDVLEFDSYTPKGSSNKPAIKKLSWDNVHLICGKSSGICPVYIYFDDNPDSNCSGLKAAKIDMNITNGVMTLVPLTKKYHLDVSSPYKLVITSAINNDSSTNNSSTPLY